ncbi:MAG: hypothetical protein AW09_000758 [Candidatus Accumulibacter phosphatis]|uniref:Uncharacterized protein n=1 Tax=Candidatus Accumulibacter phosphatis TaxID=327160 RepID=A0A080LYN0_9PROT|nr:MAG: hypothetical protein AW09_000758 [Candidatus Accumulibacter phosphatis]
MIHQRLTHFERVCHAGTVNLGIDVTHQIGLEIEVLDHGQRIVGVRPPRMVAKNVLGAVAVDFFAETIGKKLAAHRATQDRNGMEVGFHRSSPHALKRRLGAEHARRPVCFRVDTAEQTKQRSAHAMRHCRAQALFHEV